ncbi:MAG: hypothetical protein EOO89_31350 [Pedobacter sp.]|nr:MAG: hypothetical protein EOO89_31350 [Pedobacter sp.]
MRHLTSTVEKYFYTVLAFSFLTLTAVAQEATTSATTTTSTNTTETSTWYTETWVWVVGAMVGILLLIALIRSGTNGRSTTNKVTVTKTTSSEDV